MVEILTLGWFVNRIAEAAQNKGGRPGDFRLMALLLWSVGEVCGLFVGLAAAPQGDLRALLIIYLCALCGAAAGAGLACVIVHNLKVEQHGVM